MKKDRRKVRNTTTKDKLLYDNIQFRSSLEVYCYQQLKKHHLDAIYEGHAYELIPKFTFIGKCLESSKNGLRLSTNNIRPWTYTPDFIGNGWIIECKGFRGLDTWPLKLKAFKYLLKDSGIDLYIPSNRKQVDECIQLIINGTTRLF